jgi:predicted phosphodiesterase
MRLAILADIHGNLAALEAVMAELERLQPDAVVVNGDLINGVPFSTEVIDFVRRQDWVVVRGNHEFYYLDFGTPRAVEGSDDAARWGALHWLVERISPEQGAYLGMLPDERTLYIPGALPVGITHGVPGRNRVGFYPEQSSASIAADLNDVFTPTFISAHTHVQVDRQVVQAAHNGASASRAAGGAALQCHVVNPGSVGLPLNGDTRAQFALLESVPEREVAGGWRATHLRVTYDRRAMLEAYQPSGMADAGGVMARMFYWELVTAETEVVRFYHWARTNGLDVDNDMAGSFAAYCRDTGRDAVVAGRDPLYQRQAR